MEYVFDKAKSELVDTVIEEIENKLSKEKAELVSPFVRKFYSTVAYDDLREHSVLDLYGAVLSFWSFMLERKPNETKVRVYNPDFETNAWQSTHTIIDVASEDMPFLVDSVVMEINRRQLTTHLIIHSGGLWVCRDSNNQIVSFCDKPGKAKGWSCIEEATIYLEIDRQTDVEVLNDLTESIQHVLSDVRIANDDWHPMQEKVKEATDDLDIVKTHLDKDELIETKDFLHWIVENHFTFLGCRDYQLSKENGDLILKIIPNTGLGVLRDTSKSKVSRRLTSMTPEARRLSLSSQILIISKTNTKSTVHRPIYTDYIGIKRFDAKGKIIGERRVIGLYTSAAYNASPKEIPFLRRKVASVIEKSGLRPRSHSGKALLNILETLPRDDLFQGSVNELLEVAMGIFYLQERRRIRMFARKDIYGRFMSCLVFVPRERFNTELRLAMQAILEKEFHATESSFSTLFSDSVLARIHFIIRFDPKKTIKYDLAKIEKQLIEIGRLWSDDLCESLLEFYGEEQGNALVNRYAQAFPASYREMFAARTAVYDIKHIENLSDKNKLELNFYKPLDDLSCAIRFKVYRLGGTIPLSDALPILENMGLRVISEEPYEIKLHDDTRCWINDFGMSPIRELTIDLDALKEPFQEAFSRIWFGDAENDGFNQLVIVAGLRWREITILRAYAKYFRQTGFTFSQTYIEQTLVNNPEISKALVELFDLCFNPEIPEKSNKLIKQTVKNLKIQMDSVASLDEDRILRRYLDLMKATLRTNFYQKDESGNAKSYLSLKLNPRVITDLPLPKPMFEIFVYSPRFEGVHLRGGKVARGGLRWSDRREDFRTEILGLMKAQQVKNAVIVPTGAKGGFVPKCLPTDGPREAIIEEGIACYKDFIRGLLDLTDNLKGSKVVPPPNVYRYDEDDTYLVVAADKGTATFSDIANTISEQYEFWLGDAFASGGSTGYDHKKMGITARGAWESVKRHFRELGMDIQSMDFTVVGIGDMSGDVFGNGMLLSRHTKMVAAFNHLHIFLDPDPDPAASFKERERLFNLSRSTWTDYNPRVLSKGGGIYSRSDKSISLSDEVKKLLHIKDNELEPNKLLTAILKAPVDLLWNAGIGTFVKSTNETHTDVGDRSNDAIRINANELKCRVVGEGGNLGFTQMARVQYALKGGLIYTDFIDNSGGVDCSDHEVNIKILLNDVVANGDMTEKQRNKLLANMTDEVSELVLHHNYRQSQAISLAAIQAVRNIELHSRYIDKLESSGKLDRSLEFLPDQISLHERKATGKGLTRPGIAILLAYSKITLKNQILNSDVPDDPYFTASVLQNAFPAPLRKKFSTQMEEHTLKREIIATQLANSMINEMGFTFVYRLYEETGAPESSIVRAYTITRTVFNLEQLWKEIESLDNRVPSQKQFALMMQLIRLIRRSTRWLLKNRRMRLDVSETIAEFAPGITQFIFDMDKFLVGDDLLIYKQRVKEYVSLGLCEDTAKYIASTRALLSAFDVIDASNQNQMSISDLAKVYFAIDDRLDLGWIRSKIIAHQVENHWEALSREALRDDLDWQQRLLTISILKHNDTKINLTKRLDNWMECYQLLIDRWKFMLTDLRGSSAMNFTMFFVAIRELLDLTQTSMQAGGELGKSSTSLPKKIPGKEKTKKDKTGKAA